MDVHTIHSNLGNIAAASFSYILFDFTTVFPVFDGPGYPLINFTQSTFSNMLHCAAIFQKYHKLRKNRPILLNWAGLGEFLLYVMHASACNDGKPIDRFKIQFDVNYFQFLKC